MSVWDTYLDQIAGITSSAIYLTVPGNHELDTPKCPFSLFHNNSSGGEANIVSAFLLPMPQSASYSQSWYDV